MAKIIIIGGGIIGLCSAYYLAVDGHKVTVVDKDDFSDNCSYGNAGYVCPSHFIPLASPGNLRQGIRWMTRSDSPFYIRPRWNRNLITWALQFARSSTNRHVTAAAVPLRDIALFSKNLYDQLSFKEGFDFGFQKKGLLEFFKTEATRHHEAQMVQLAGDLGINARLLNREEVLSREPSLNPDILGALYFESDAHLYPNQLMHCLLRWLEEHRVELRPHAKVESFITQGRTLKGIKSEGNLLEADQFVLAAGSWSGQLASKLGLKIPVVGGRGYSLTLHHTEFNLLHPVILTEARVALTPLNAHSVRIGGTMEITSLNAPPELKRMEAILKAVKNYMPDWDIPTPDLKEIWTGFRPCSADGLPYIGRVKTFDNLTVATGHAMIGLSLGAGTGKLVSEIINERTPSIQLSAFDPQRFG